MNNSFDRLIDGMIDALRHEVIPHTATEYARGQAFGVIFLLQNLRLRAAWSPDFLNEFLDALAALRTALLAIPGLPADAPLPAPCRADGASAAELLRIRDAGDASVCSLIDWAAQNTARLAPPVLAAVNATVSDYLRRTLQYEIRNSAKPMFTQMSLGRETTD